MTNDIVNGTKSRQPPCINLSEASQVVISVPKGRSESSMQIVVVEVEERLTFKSSPSSQAFPASVLALILDNLQ